MAVEAGLSGAVAGGCGLGSSVRVTGLDVDITPEMQQVSDRFGGTPVFRAHMAFGPLAPGQE
ncbi:MAG: hypothetical protein V2I51_12430 [Anderseniella sp.]|nr:hypothetical protein [Anderseniella sp.]